MAAAGDHPLARCWERLLRGFGDRHLLRPPKSHPATRGEGNGRAKTVKLLHEEERFYSVTQIGITLVSLGLGAVGGDAAYGRRPPG
jgi:hypothetical protein